VVDRPSLNGMCEHCGCREIEPIARLMDEHLEMLELSGQIRRSLLAGFQPRGPEPIFVDPLLAREPEAAKDDDEGGDDATGAVS